MFQVYTTFSRRPPSQVHRALTDLKVEYLVLSSQWCLTTERGGCALTEVSWILLPFTGDAPLGSSMMINTLRSGILRNPGLRRQAVLQHVPHSGTGLSQNSVSTKFDCLPLSLHKFLFSRPPLPFLSVFSNQEYKVLRVNPRVLEIKSKKSEKI